MVLLSQNLFRHKGVIVEEPEPLVMRQEFMLLLSDTEIQKLYRLAGELGVTTSHLVRHWIAQQ